MEGVSILGCCFEALARHGLGPLPDASNKNKSPGQMRTTRTKSSHRLGEYSDRCKLLKDLQPVLGLPLGFALGLGTLTFAHPQCQRQHPHQWQPKATLVGWQTSRVRRSRFCYCSVFRNGVVYYSFWLAQGAPFEGARTVGPQHTSNYMLCFLFSFM